VAQRTRWSDERLEDLAKVVYHNDGRLDVTERVATHASEEVAEMKKHTEMRSRSRVEQFAIAAALFSPITTLVFDLIYHH
jgi:hypothetical protein